MYLRNIKTLTELKVWANQSQKIRAEMHRKIMSEIVSNNSSKTHNTMCAQIPLFQTPKIQSPLLELLII